MSCFYFGQLVCFSLQLCGHLLTFLLYLCPHPNDESDISKSHPEPIRTPTHLVVLAILNQEARHPCDHASWEGLREGPLHPLAGGRDNFPLGDTETGLGSWTRAHAYQPEIRLVSSRWGGVHSWVGISPGQLMQHNVQGLISRVTQFRLICQDYEVLVSDVSTGGAW